MAKKNFGDKVGTCKICGINLWSASNGKPAIFPCGVASCPYELEGAQFVEHEFSNLGSSIAQLREDATG
jgi:hypothetical protein